MVKLLEIIKKKYRFHEDCIKHIDFHTQICKSNMSNSNKIIMCNMWIEITKSGRQYKNDFLELIRFDLTKNMYVPGDPKRSNPQTRNI